MKNLSNATLRIFLGLGMIAGLSPSVIAQGHSDSAVSGNGLVSRETKRRSPRELQIAGVGSMYKLPKFEGIGFSLGREGVFRNNVNLMKSSFYSKSGYTGSQFLAALKKYSEKSCIPNLLLAGHGWGAGDGKRDSIATGSTSRDAGRGIYLDGAGATIKGSLAKMVASGEVRFCKSCQVFLHACSISDEFSSNLARVSGCTVVSATYKVSPVDTNTGVYDHVWFTSARGKFFKYSPAKVGVVNKKTIGQEFIFDPR